MNSSTSGQDTEAKLLSTTNPTSRMDQQWWKDRHELKMKDNESLSELDVLLVGDSITQGWETTGKEAMKTTFKGLSILNLGFSGDRTEHVIWRIQNGEVDGIQPAVTMVLIGTNNTGHNLDKPVDIAQGVRVILDELATRLPDTRILLLGVFPYDKDPESPRRKNNESINELIKEFHDGQRVHYLDICARFFNESGEMTTVITPDFLHLSEAGYRIWADAVIEKVRELKKHD